MTLAPPQDAVLAEARAFLAQYGAETGAGGEAARLRQIEAELARTGTYGLNTEELTFAARVAWRNSTRCVGRLPWRALGVRDRRDVLDADAVYADLLDHLREADHGGAIRPLLTVYGPGVRVLNPQLIRYADDPDQRAFVAWLRAQGWAPSGTRFELLPVAIQAGGEVRLYDLPPGAVREVEITHPDCPAIADLGLRWHALPVISDMALCAGGLSLPCVFNGWYVGTEIAARNLADEGRYDMLPAVARALGLDTGRARSLWRDRALVELNVAVLHSFDAAGVRISDHHGVTAQFAEFEAQEARAGREVRGRWSWLIPPVSPATTPVWHRSYDDREERPYFERLPAPWGAGGCPFSKWRVRTARRRY